MQSRRGFFGLLAGFAAAPVVRDSLGNRAPPPFPWAAPAASLPPPPVVFVNDERTGIYPFIPERWSEEIMQSFKSNLVAINLVNKE